MKNTSKYLPNNKFTLGVPYIRTHYALHKSTLYVSYVLHYCHYRYTRFPPHQLFLGYLIGHPFCWTQIFPPQKHHKGQYQTLSSLNLAFHPHCLREL